MRRPENSDWDGLVIRIISRSSKSQKKKRKVKKETKGSQNPLEFPKT